ncbi:MAG: hypothetical protein IPP61_14860 [Cytophagaceae bacterium]|nr:hypothetical protein [Cytophagaceae bacterium]MBK9932700.1 hypothetical protein [Cytophagaceae bacterium]MBL0303609.1 hypothetical protein [Cytophagaceae bacterium]MBL0326438.1 hypothetical protein [Cytophagaceae bacterium]
MKSLDKFAGLEIKNTEEVKGGTFGLLSGLFGGCGYTQPKTCYTPPVNNCYTPPKNNCYTPPQNSCGNGGYQQPTPPSCTPKPNNCNSGFSWNFSFSFGCR